MKSSETVLESRKMHCRLARGSYEIASRALTVATMALSIWTLRKLSCMSPLYSW